MSSFDQLKHALSTAPILRYPNFEEPFEILSQDPINNNLSSLCIQNFTEKRSQL